MCHTKSVISHLAKGNLSIIRSTAMAGRPDGRVSIFWFVHTTHFLKGCFATNKTAAPSCPSHDMIGTGSWEGRVATAQGGCEAATFTYGSQEETASLKVPKIKKIRRIAKRGPFE